MTKEIILVVDDNHDLADFVAQQLLPSLGYETRIAYDGASGLELVKSIQPALLLLDLELPDTNGLDLLRRLNKDGFRVPTIIVTAHGSEQVAVDAFRLGVQDYLIKPADADDLEKSITRALSESRLRQETVRLNTQLTEQITWLNTLSKIGQSITSTLDPDEVLRRIVEAGVRLTRAEEGFLALLDRNSGQFYLRAAKNIDEDRIKTMHLPVENELVSRVIQTGRPLRMTSDSSGSSLKVSTGFLVSGLLHVPIFSKGQLLGVLSVDNRLTRRTFSQIDETILVSLADYAAIALENASLYLQSQFEINERKRVEQALRESEERYALAVRGANDGIWDWNLQSNRIYYSPRWKSMLGYEEQGIGDDPRDWFNRVHPQDIEKLKLALSAHIRGVTAHFENEHRVLHKDGSYCWMLSRGLAVHGEDGSVNRIAGSQTDISVRKNAEAKLLHDAFYDRLTSLPNRALFMDHLKSAIERSKRHADFGYAVLFLDLDQFKNINDSFGHLFGDQLLIAIGNLLKANIRTSDTLARLSGDEFVILLEEIKDASAATRVCEWILKKLVTPIRMGANDVFMTASIGIVLSSEGYHQPEDVLRDADIAMYAAKARGKANYELFKPAMRERILKRMEVETDLRQAIQDNQLLIYYQPIFSFKTGILVGFEALARWQHPTRGLIEPLDFIPLARETGLIRSIDYWVIEEACRQVGEWQANYQMTPALKINTNLTGTLVSEPGLIVTVKKILLKTGFDAHNLCLEITESAVMEYNENVMGVIEELREMGIEVHIDDFGTGYSSLVYLQNFPVSALKIDQTFVKQISDQGENAEIVRTIVDLAHDLGMKALAEGVETEMQLTKLKSLGCDCGQGFLFAHPLAPKIIAGMLENFTANGNPFSPWQAAMVTPSPDLGTSPA